MLTFLALIGLQFTAFTQGSEMCGLIGNPLPQLQSQPNVNHGSHTTCQIHRDAFPNLDISVIPNIPNQLLKIHLNFIFVQKTNGGGNFDLANEPDQAALFDSILEEMNARVRNIVNSPTCNCPEQFVPDLQFEFVPHYVDVFDSFYWNHENDPQPNVFNSSNKSFLNEIVALAQLESNFHQSGYNIIYTADGTEVDQFAVDPNTNIFDQDDYDLTYTINVNAVAYSMFPNTFDKTAPMQLHMPNSYRGWLQNSNLPTWIPSENSFWTPEWEINFQTGALLHEIFHGFGLSHSSACGDTDNIMLSPLRKYSQ